MAFQVYAYEQTLRDEGLGEKEARAIAKAMELHVFGQMATREALEQTIKTETTAVRNEISSSKSELKADISAMKFELLKWIVGVTAGSTFAVVMALIRFAK